MRMSFCSSLWRARQKNIRFEQGQKWSISAAILSSKRNYLILPWWLGGRAMAWKQNSLYLGGSIPSWGGHDYMVPMDPQCYIRPGCVLYVSVSWKTTLFRVIYLRLEHKGTQKSEQFKSKCNKYHAWRGN